MHESRPRTPASWASWTRSLRAEAYSLFAYVEVYLSSPDPVLPLPIRLMSVGDAPGARTFTFSGLPPGCVGDPTRDRGDCVPSLPSATAVSITVNDSSPGGASTPPLPIVVNPLPRIASFTRSPSTVAVDSLLERNATTQGGSPPFTSTYPGLPPGCASVHESDLSCLPAAAGAFNITLNATDSVGVSRFATVALLVIPPAAPPSAPPSGGSWWIWAAAAVGGAAVILGAGWFRGRSVRSRSGVGSL
jgi:hypothetical protein